MKRRRFLMKKAIYVPLFQPDKRYKSGERLWAYLRVFVTLKKEDVK